MDKDIIEHIRKELVKELTTIEGKPRKMRLRSELAEEILFDTDEVGMKTFALPIDLMKKIDFGGISFKDFFAIGFDFTEFKGVTIDPQTVFGKDLSFATLSGVTIVNTFDGVALDGTDFDGMIYKTWEIKAKQYINSMKKIKSKKK